MKALILLLLLTLPVFAQTTKEGKKIIDWSPLFETVDQNTQIRVKAYYAPESIRRGDDYTKAWLRVDFPDGSRALFTNWPGPDIHSMRIYLTLRCQQHSTAGGSMVLYDSNSGVLLAKDIKESASEGAGTLGQWLLDNFCEREAEIRAAEPPKLKPKK